MSIEAANEELDFDEDDVDPFQAALSEAEIIGIASILSLGPAPFHWSSRAMSRQRVRLRLDEVLRGQVPPGTELDVEFAVVEHSPTAGGPAPGLNPKLFAVKSRLVVLLKRLEDRWLSVDERHGALPLERLESLRALA